MKAWQTQAVDLALQGLDLAPEVAPDPRVAVGALDRVARLEGRPPQGLGEPRDRRVVDARLAGRGLSRRGRRGVAAGPASGGDRNGHGIALVNQNQATRVADLFRRDQSWRTASGRRRSGPASRNVVAVAPGTRRDAGTCGGKPAPPARNSLVMAHGRDSRG